MLRRLLICIAALVLGTSAAVAQPVRSLSDEARISLITSLPGERVHTEFGHSAFRVHDPVHDIDWLYNYGTFNFDDPLFLPKFTYGRLTYFLSVASYPGMVRFYRQEGRPVIEQPLALSSEQEDALFRFLQINARPENRYYAYDFLFDNCSTRIRDALETTFGDAVTFAPKPDLDQSFRRLLDPYVADRPLLDVGFDLALGTPADAIATPRETMFLPEHLLTAFNHASIEVEDQVRPLVTRTDTVLWIDGYDATERAFPWPFVAGWSLFAATLLWTLYRGWQMQAPNPTVDAVLLGLVGGAGWILCFLWFISEHTVTDHNWNLLWSWPTHLVVAALWGRAANASHVQRYLAITAAATLLVGLSWVWWPQDLHAAIQPLVLALGIRFGGSAVHNWRRQRDAAASLVSS